MTSVPRPLGLALVLAIITQAVFQALQTFVGPVATTVRRPASLSVARRAEEEAAEGEGEGEDEPEERKPKKFKILSPFRGLDLDGDNLNNLEEWYQETISGKGGAPKGFIADLVLRSFYGEWLQNGWLTGTHVRNGPNNQANKADFQTALKNMRIAFENDYRMESQIDDGSEWIWLVACQNGGGLYLRHMKEVPFGYRPLALIKKNNIGEFFEKVNWHILYIRIHKWQLWGGKVRNFPLPIVWKQKLQQAR
eukprot:CAMPEP_0197647338 /NCGR_PEP_ID=MMETSP1338-20131121/24966_1 /TAXON_ID=43686 ORGANISM="Pelagodinium beii, Strain RCC1491" /NCGR_SAMPLE_ID=MMETSP1338 /ASSEMBLY_ACC=CAM_ASM_000754 /LENGTH=250 /DNA_ID=CAMNT_0043221109 /DNA_START=40 /DNA_END=792 /DNA_ORIENTATION=+